MKLRKTEKTLAVAAAKAGMDEKTARKWLRMGILPSQCQRERNWRTRTDVFEGYWEEIEKILKRAPTVLVTTLFDYLCRQYPGQFQEGQLRTLQRRIKTWRACHGEPQEVFFSQRHRPGDQAQSDFTHMGSLGVTIAGEPFEHPLYHFVLTYSNWETGTICFTESFESLSTGLQNALWELGGVPQEHHTDSLSSAVHQLKHPEEFTDRYQELLNHYGLKASHSQAGKAHENGDVEQAHFRFKQIRAKDGQIEIWAPEGVVTPEVRDHLKAVKGDLLKLVRWRVRRIEIPSQTKPGYVDVWMSAENVNEPDHWRCWFVESRPGEAQKECPVLAGGPPKERAE